ncbi:Acriflavin resistance protein [hydrothermal vent metagenome]|uniref:Acriflavin resistance protein n=1 Tax=hydrothermal vent metagenome TaxID=652676 RepID=A0A3B0VPB6_9ZZZZ
MKKLTNWRKGIIYWFAINPVAANLLMAIILIVGLVSVSSTRKEMFPSTAINMISITVAFPGAAPVEVEEGVCLKIEQSLTTINGIDKITCSAAENIGTTIIEVDDNYDLGDVTNDIKNKIDGINSFPEQVEKPIISQIDTHMQAIFVSLYGDVTDKQLRSYAFDVRDEIIDIAGISSATVVGANDLEVSIEVSEKTLRKYQLTFDEIALAIRSSSLDLPAGAIKSKKGDVLLRALGKADTKDDFGNIVIRSFANGTNLKLQDIATITDGFAESSRFSTFDGERAISIQIDAIGDDDILDVTAKVKQYVADKQAQLPENMNMSHWSDISYYVNGRIDLMTKNMLLGSIMVLLILTLFLRLKVAFWVMVGLPVAFLGTFIVMSYVGVTINMLSLFGFILVLGVVVDDAIVIGESAYKEIQDKGHSIENVVKGAQAVALPATFGVLTTIAAFIPLLFVGTIFGSFFEAIGWVVILSLLFSLIESKLILPSHLSHMKISDVETKKPGVLLRVQRKVNYLLDRLIKNGYQPLLHKAVRRPFLATLIFICILILAIGMLRNGIVRFVMNPSFTADFIFAQVKMTEGTSDAITETALAKIEQGILDIDTEYSQASGQQNGLIVEHISLSKQNQLDGILIVELIKEDIILNGDEVLKLWSEKVGQITGAEVLAFGSLIGPGDGPEIAFKLTSDNIAELKLASTELADKISEYQGVTDVRNSMKEGKDEVQLNLKPRGHNLGLTQRDLANQVRQAFYGEEIQRLQREVDEVKVMLKYPLSERETMATLDSMRIRLKDGTAIPITSVANISIGKASDVIIRIDRKRASTISGDADLKVADPNGIMAELKSDGGFMEQLQTKYPSVKSAPDGVAKEMAELGESMLKGFFIAMLFIYMLMAIPLKSYTQPLIIMMVIPFGITGAILGHWITGYTMSMISLFGVIALGGVVVNDSLVMVDFINKYRQQGHTTLEAAMAAGTRRFRAILLTSLTTFFGLLPMLLETSLQAKVIIPMAVSLAFGILFATVITLILIPVWYVILERFKGSEAVKNL